MSITIYIYIVEMGIIKTTWSIYIIDALKLKARLDFFFFCLCGWRYDSTNKLIKLKNFKSTTS